MRRAALPLGCSQRHHLSRKRIAPGRPGESGELRPDHAGTGRDDWLRRASRALRLPHRRAATARDPLHVSWPGRASFRARRCHVRKSDRMVPVGWEPRTMTSHALISDIILGGGPRHPGCSVWSVRALLPVLFLSLVGPAGWCLMVLLIASGLGIDVRFLRF